MKRLNPIPMVALTASFALMAVSVSMGVNTPGGAMIFVDPASFVITVLGSFCSLVTSFPFAILLKTPRIIKSAFSEPIQSRKEIVDIFSGLSRKARTEGLLALEEEVQNLEDEFLVRGMQMVIDGVEPENIREILEFEVYSLEKRHSYGHAIFAKWAEFAPAFGMIGTLIGLILMLTDLTNADGIGVGMATALITTLYGSLFANIIFLPIGNQLQVRTEEEVFTMEMIIEGVLSIQSGINPRIVEEKLLTYVLPEDRFVEEYKKGDIYGQKTVSKKV
ncbi:MAG: MotA/TolQ/ExbB proton channel family protein [Peptostreptococcales bacterium]